MRVSVRVGSLLHGVGRPVRYRRSCMDPAGGGVVQVERGPPRPRRRPDRGTERGTDRSTLTSSLSGPGPTTGRARGAGTGRDDRARTADRRAAAAGSPCRWRWRRHWWSPSSRPRWRGRRHLATDRGGLPRDREPGPAAGRRLDGVHDATGGRGFPGGARISRRGLAGRVRARSSRLTGGRGHQLDGPSGARAGAWVRHPRVSGRGRPPDDGRGPADGRHRRR